MNIIDELQCIFPASNAAEKNEKYSTFYVEYTIDLEALRQLTKQKIQGFFDLLKSKAPTDSWRLIITIENFEPASIDTSQKEAETFWNTIKDSMEYVENEKITLKFNINKSHSDGITNIYGFKGFDDFIGNLKVVQLLNVINNDLKKYKFLKFNLFEYELEEFYSRNIYFGKNRFQNINAMSPESFESKSREFCFFGNHDEYPYSPKHFHLIKRPTIADNLVNKLDRLSYIFSIINIFDITSIRKDDTLYYKLNGYKTIEGVFSIDTDCFDDKSHLTYIKICDWIYSDPSNIVEKLGLARNILSIYLKEGSLQISEDAYFSIQSGFKTYLQENLNRYIEVRSNISEQLEHINQKANNAIDKYLNDYQKSSITFVSFFLSILVFRVLNTGEFVDAFTKDATILSFLLLAISLLYLLFSLWNLNGEKNRLKIRYKNLKRRFEDLLIKEDIERILQHDREFKEEIDFINKRTKAYTILWIITILMVFIAVLSLSSYYNWLTINKAFKTILNWIFNLF